jgi:hypothetical protein
MQQSASNVQRMPAFVSRLVSSDQQQHFTSTDLLSSTSLISVTAPSCGVDDPAKHMVMAGTASVILVPCDMIIELQGKR